MPSPFPGMNPYLEQESAWNDFHQSYITAARDALAGQVLPTYYVKIEEHLFIHELPGSERRLLGRSDVSITPAPHRAAPGATQTLAPPVVAIIPPAVDVERQSYLEIRDRDSRELVTVVEMLSPSNKRAGTDRDQYLAKRRRVLASSVHLVELDFLRGWERLPLEKLPDCSYYALVSRAEGRPEAGVWPLGLRDPLPTIPVPLRAADPDARLDLQALLHHVYDAAHYELYIYAGQPHPRLGGADATWAAGLVAPSK